MILDLQLLSVASRIDNWNGRILSIQKGEPHKRLAFFSKDVCLNPRGLNLLNPLARR